MEKFGIFELLDALAALTAPQEESEREHASDPAFLPPDYLKEEKKDEKEESKAPPPKIEQDALSAFYAKHDSVAKKAKK